MYMHGLALPRSVQKREGLLNCALFMLEEHAHDDPIMALKRLMHGNRTTFARDLVTVLKSPALDEGDEWQLDSSPLTLGRGAQNDVPLDKDEYASSSHARIEPRRDGVWVEDIGSTNGTYLNGIRLTRPKRLTPGDVVRVGETELRYDA